MSRKRASLAGKGAEILFGAAAEDSTEESVPPQDQDIASAGHVSLKEDQPAVGTPSEGIAVWAAGLAEEAESATAGAEPGVLILPAPAAESEPVEVQPQPLPADSAPVTEELPSLATTPAQPAEELPSLATAPAQPEEALPALATTPAQPAETLPSFESAPAYPAVPEEEPVTLRPEFEADAITPPAPMYAGPVPASEVPSTSPLAGVPATLPPPREKPEASDPALRTRVYGAIYDAHTTTPSAEQIEPDGPTSPGMTLPTVDEYEANQPSRQRTEDEVLRAVTAEQRRILSEKIFALYQQVPDVLCMDELQDEALQLLQTAQDILLEKPRQFDVALYKVSQAESIVNRRRNIDRWTNTYGWGIFAYEMLWVLGLAAAILFAPAVIGWIESIVGEVPYFISVSGLWMTAAWGSAGGVLGALYSLYWHAAKVKDFHKQYLMWYVVQPVIGILIGAFVYLITGAGFIGATGENVVTGETSVIPLFRYAVAAIASFRQRFILEVVDRVIQLLTSPFQTPEKPSTAEQPPAEPEGASGGG